MFTACTTPDLKEGIVKSFTQLNRKLRIIIIATLTFGMGMDCPNVHKIIHCGPPSDVESYICIYRRLEEIVGMRKLLMLSCSILTNNLVREILRIVW